MTMMDLDAPARGVPATIGGRLVAALDVGLSKTVCVVGAVSDPDVSGVQAVTDIAGFGLIASPAAACGQPADFDACARSIRIAVEEAERSAGAHIERVIASYGGPGLSARRGEGAVRVRAGVVSARDVAGAVHAAAACVPVGHRVLHIAPLAYRVDDGPDMPDPRGLEGERLSATVTVVTAPISALDALADCALAAGVEIEEIVAAPYAAGYAALDVEDRPGAAVIDLGAGGASVAVFSARGLEFAGMVPGGGMRLTRALAQRMETTFAVAERVKLGYGAEMERYDPRAAIEAPRIGPDGRLEPALVLRSTIHQTIGARLDETFQRIAGLLAEAGVGRPAHIALVGGGACLAGAAEIAQARLGAPAVVGGVSTVPGLEQAMCSAPFATAAGLMRWACERPPQADAAFARTAARWRTPVASIGVAASRAWRWLQASF